VKRPGTGEILAKDFRSLLGRPATRTIEKNEQLKWSDVGEA
jgi:sialic acid synthase SpsE